MNPVPIYEAHNLNPAYALRYSWTAFPSGSELFSADCPASLLAELAPMWEADGLRLLEHQWAASQIQMTFSTTPNVAPERLAARAKGRLQHALRSVGNPVKFARNFSIRSLGDNTRGAVERYVRKQLEGGDFADPKYRDQLKASTWTDPAVDLSNPLPTSSGRYWYNLHLVLVMADRYSIGAGTTALVISETCRAVAKKHGYRIAVLSVMPDHLHMALQGASSESPEDIVLCFQNNIAWKLGQARVLEHNYYAGTVGEYTMRAVRTKR